MQVSKNIDLIAETYQKSKWLEIPSFIRSSDQQGRASTVKPGTDETNKKNVTISDSLVEGVDVRDLVINYDRTDTTEAYCLNDGHRIQNSSEWRFIPTRGSLHEGKLCVAYITCGNTNCMRQYVVENRRFSSMSILNTISLMMLRIFQRRDTYASRHLGLSHLPSINPLSKTTIGNSIDSYRKTMDHVISARSVESSTSHSLYQFIPQRCQFHRVITADYDSFGPIFWNNLATFLKQPKERIFDKKLTRERDVKTTNLPIRVEKGRLLLCSHDLCPIPESSPLFYRPSSYDQPYGEKCFQIDPNRVFCSPNCCKSWLIARNMSHMKVHLGRLYRFCSRLGWKGPIVSAPPREILNKFRRTDDEWGTISFFRQCSLDGVCVELLPGYMGSSSSKHPTIDYSGDRWEFGVGLDPTM